MMHRILPFVPGLFSAAALTAAGSALALPAPQSDAELLANSDLVVDAVVTSAECVGRTIETATSFRTTYESAVDVNATVKGTAPALVSVVGVEEVFRMGGSCAAGNPTVNPGWAGRLHLVDLGNGSFEATWYNGFKEDVATSAPMPLPNCDGAGGAGGSSAGSAGAAGSAGSAGAAGGAGTAGSSNAADSGSGDDGSCSIAGAPNGASAFPALVAAVAAGFARRRRAGR